MSGLPLHFVGLHGFGANPAQVEKGRRRVVTGMAFIAFVLLVAGAADEDWVAGGLQFDQFTALPPASRDRAMAVARTAGLNEDEIAALAAPGPLGATVTRNFKFGLTMAMIEGSATLFPTFIRNATAPRVSTSVMSYYPMVDFCTNINMGIDADPSVSFWAGKGLGKIDTRQFAGTLGLTIFAAVLQGLVWIVLVLVQYEAPVVVSSKWTPIALRVVAPLCAFFAVIAWVVFLFFKLETEFCKAFVPDQAYLNLPCDKGNGFGCVVAGSVFATLEAAALWLWVSPNFGPVYSLGAMSVNSLGGLASYDGTASTFQGGDAFKSYQDTTTSS